MCWTRLPVNGGVSVIGQALHRIPRPGVSRRDPAPIDLALHIVDEEANMLAEPHAWQTTVAGVLKDGFARDAEELGDVRRVLQARPLELERCEFVDRTVCGVATAIA
jgi:hypothetical protein